MLVSRGLLSLPPSRHQFGVKSAGAPIPCIARRSLHHQPQMLHPLPQPWPPEQVPVPLTLPRLHLAMSLTSSDLGMNPHQEKVIMLLSTQECWEQIVHFWSLLKWQLAPGDAWSSSLLQEQPFAPRCSRRSWE